MQREDYPNPLSVRPRLKLLNGVWDYECDPKDNLSDVLYRPLSGAIVLPYSAGSTASGVTITGKERSVWYRKTFTLDAFEASGTVILNFTSIDYRGEVYVNNRLAGISKGGYAPVKFNITALVTEGENVITVNALDDHSDPAIPSGDQAKTTSDGGKYSPTIGIRGDVWLEFCAKTYFGFVRPFASFRDKTIYLQGNIEGETEGAKVRVEIAYGKKQIATYNYKATSTLNVKAPVPGQAIYLWAPNDGKIYDIRISLYNANGGLADMIYTYCAFREINFLGKKLYINGRETFLKTLELNGIYPGTGYVPKDSTAVAQDVALALALGFNAVQFHKRYPLPKELYICDKLGVPVRAELMSSGANLNEPTAESAFFNESVILTQYNFGHPSIINWIPFSDYNYDGSLQAKAYSTLKANDPTRPISSSGGILYATDLYEFEYTSYERLIPMLYERGNGGIYDEKEEKKFYKDHPGALTQEAIKKLPAYVYGVTAGEFTRGEYFPEKAYLEEYKRVTEAIFKSGAIGFTFSKFYDVDDERRGILDNARNIKLSREGIRVLREANAKLVPTPPQNTDKP